MAERKKRDDERLRQQGPNPDMMFLLPGEMPVPPEESRRLEAIMRPFVESALRAWVEQLGLQEANIPVPTLLFFNPVAGDDTEAWVPGGGPIMNPAIRINAQWAREAHEIRKRETMAHEMFHYLVAHLPAMWGLPRRIWQGYWSYDDYFPLAEIRHRVPLNVSLPVASVLGRQPTPQEIQSAWGEEEAAMLAAWHVMGLQPHQILPLLVARENSRLFQILNLPRTDIEGVPQVLLENLIRNYIRDVVGTLRGPDAYRRFAESIRPLGQGGRR